jgi:hypothetical protein
MTHEPLAANELAAVRTAADTVEDYIRALPVLVAARAWKQRLTTADLLAEPTRRLWYAVDAYEAGQPVTNPTTSDLADTAKSLNPEVHLLAEITEFLASAFPGDGQSRYYGNYREAAQRIFSLTLAYDWGPMDLLAKQLDAVRPVTNAAIAYVVALTERNDPFGESDMRTQRYRDLAAALKRARWALVDAVLVYHGAA